MPSNAPSNAPPNAGFKIPESVLVVIHTRDLEVLLLERADRPGFWQSVTGSKEHRAEAARDTAIREVAEETGIEIGSERVPSAALSDWKLTTTYEIYEHWRHRYGPGVTENLEHTFGLLVPRDIVDATLFLASDASRMMTGQAMVVDGGVVVTG